MCAMLVIYLLGVEAEGLPVWWLFSSLTNRKQGLLQRLGDGKGSGGMRKIEKM